MKAKDTPLEDLKQQALEHYEEASKAIHHYNSFVVKCIKEYQPIEPISRERMTPSNMKITLIKFLMWYKKLSHTDKCTVHPPAGSGGCYGLYELSDKDLVDKYLRYRINSIASELCDAGQREESNIAKTETDTEKIIDMPELNCWNCGKSIVYLPNGLAVYRCECGAVHPEMNRESNSAEWRLNHIGKQAIQEPVNNDKAIIEKQDEYIQWLKEMGYSDGEFPIHPEIEQELNQLKGIDHK